ncbi:SUMF1/EgtB/PvdO family nonheme iron enzyme [candidate division KSB1 bacterium]|nr:SUMF1/EgtB/PvdO family nonheme iron enzyme [candidate division KSB1 bacterium]
MAAKMPRLFIPSTIDDLREYRNAVRDVAIRAGFFPVMAEYFTPEGERPPYAECMKQVDECDLLVVLVAHRYGWIPKDQPEQDDYKSITWLECEQAFGKKAVIPFLIDPKFPWPEEQKEEYRTTKAMKEKKLTPELAMEVYRDVGKLEDFRTWLNSIGIRGTFDNPDKLGTLVLQALVAWRDEHQKEFGEVKLATDEKAYLKWLNKQCEAIDIRGLQEGSAKAHKFGIEELYIPLKTQARSAHIELDAVLRHARVTIIGDPGSGKTTFLRRIAFILTQDQLNLEPDAAKKKLKFDKKLFPVFIRLSELAVYLNSLPNSNPCTPVLLARFMVEKSDANFWGFSVDFFIQKFKAGEAILLLDGLDEAPNRQTREKLSELVIAAVQAYEKTPFVVTSRPLAYTGKVVLQDFEHFTIDALEPEAMSTFLLHWSQALFRNNPEGAAAHHAELLFALKSKPEIRRMAKNPVMLTALAVVHWNEKRIPEQRADLYDSIITWLLKSREKREGRLPADDCGRKLQKLALAMQMNPKGRQTQIGQRSAAEILKDEFDGKNDAGKIQNAEKFIDEEEVDSGIIVERGNEIAFWHLTFQEFLAAKALGGKVESDQQKILVKKEILHNTDWRETLLLFGGILHQQGKDKVDNFFKAVLTLAIKAQSLADEARCVGLIGAMLRDLKPFNYQLTNPDYRTILDRVMAIFDKDKYKSISLNIRLEAADALGQAGDPRLHPDNEDRWVTIPAGSFLMGAQSTDPKKPNFDKDAHERESPVHEVQLSEFRISKYLVTVEEYSRFIQEGGYENPAYWSAGGFKKFDAPGKWEDQLSYPSRPVVRVCWYEAMAFALWAGCQLPTEAQWERAAKGKSQIYKKYPWGNEPPDGKITNCPDSKLRHASPVGMFPDDCTDEEVLDMGGNVWEWCRDYYDGEFYQKVSETKDPVNKNKSRSTVVRGGSWYYSGTRVFRCAYRDSGDPGVRVVGIGFRVVSSAQSVDLRI